MSAEAVQEYLSVLFTKAVDEAADRIEFIPCQGAGMVRYFERNDLCHCTELPAALHFEIVREILENAHVSFKQDAGLAESWMRLRTETGEARVHVTARNSAGGAMLKLSF